jgi:carbon storage regulator CsrA
MLVLTRKCQESIVVGESLDARPLLTVTVLQVAAGRVKLGFEMQRDVLVHRWEVWEKLRSARPAALDPDAGL